METMLTVQDVADQLQLNYLTVYFWVKSGKLPSSKLGRQYRISQAQVNEFLRVNAVKAPAVRA